MRILPFGFRIFMTLLTSLLLCWPGLKVGAAQAAEMASPADIVVAFQTDYLRWNNQTVAAKAGHTPADNIAMAEKTYLEMLKKYTLPDFVGEPVAYSSEPLHDPAKEKIVSVKTQGGAAVVTTKFPQQFYTPTYEYRLVYQQHRWYLTAVDLVDDDGKYPSL